MVKKDNTYKQCQVTYMKLVLFRVALIDCVVILLWADQRCPRVGWTRGSGHDLAGFWRFGSGRVSPLDCVFFSVYFLVPDSI